MKTRHLQIKLVLILIVFFTNAGLAQGPLCIGNYYYQAGSFGCIWYHPASNPAISLGGYFILSPNASGLAIGSNFGFPAPNPTYWTVINGNYYYYSGSSFVNSGHSSGGSNFINPGASANYIYNISSSGQISKYNGTGSATIIATFTECASPNAVQDVVGDNQDNFYILKTSMPQSLMVFDQMANQICSYSVTGAPSGVGLAVNRGIVNVINELGNSNFHGMLTNNVVEFTTSSALSCGIQHDYAVCPSDVMLIPIASIVPDAVLPCLGGTRTITSSDFLAQNSYTWSGPGILGSVNSHSIVLNTPGVYSRTVVNCAGQSDVSTYTITQSNTAPLQVNQSAYIYCETGNPVNLSVSGLDNYVWTPANSLSAANGSLVNASPLASTVYTVSGFLNGCPGSAVMTVSASALPEYNPSTLTPSICAGSSVALTFTTAGNGIFLWQPGSLTGLNVVVTPQASTIFSLSVTNFLGCSSTKTLGLDVFDYPQLSTTLSKDEICIGESVNLNASGATAYLLEPGNFSGSNILISPSSSQVYTLTGSNWNCSASRTLEVTVNPLPQLVLSTSQEEICAGETVTLQVNGAVSYLWSDNSTQAQVIVSPVGEQTYSVTGTSDKGCENTGTILQKVNECVGLHKKFVSGPVRLFPNPGNQELTVDPAGQRISLQMYNAQGSLIMDLNLEDKTELETSHLSAGAYMVRIGKQDGSLQNVRYVRE